MGKRIIDFVLASIGLVLLSPIMVAVAIWIKLDSPGPIFYRGRRAGRHGQPFNMLKFRSMVVDADRLGGPTTAGGDQRVTRSGTFVRKYKFDELSQLINVIRGEMSLVGPRPEILDKVTHYSTEEQRVLALRPGITDWASIWNSDEGAVLDGAVDADAVYEKVIRPTKLALQLYYVNHHSLWSDFRIVSFTFLKIINKSWVPVELTEYPSFDALRTAALQEIREQQALAVA